MKNCHRPRWLCSSLSEGILSVNRHRWTDIVLQGRELMKTAVSCQLDGCCWRCESRERVPGSMACIKRFRGCLSVRLSCSANFTDFLTVLSRLRSNPQSPTPFPLTQPPYSPPSDPPHPSISNLSLQTSSPPSPYQPPATLAPSARHQTPVSSRTW